MNAEDLISILDMKPLPEEGGYYCEAYRGGHIPQSALPNHNGDRCFATHIYYLVTPTEFSALHRVNSDEHFHHYAGDPVRMVQIDERGNLSTCTIGKDIATGERPYISVPRRVWQGTKLAKDCTNGWALLGCTVAPGFEFDDFEIRSRNELVKCFPKHAAIIEEFTR